MNLYLKEVSNMGIDQSNLSGSNPEILKEIPCYGLQPLPNLR